RAAGRPQRAARGLAAQHDRRPRPGRPARDGVRHLLRGRRRGAVAGERRRRRAVGSLRRAAGARARRGARARGRRAVPGSLAGARRARYGAGERVTTLGALGEVEVVRRLLAVQPSRVVAPRADSATTAIAVGPGDDAAIVRPRPGHALVTTTDTLLE